MSNLPIIKEQLSEKVVYKYRAFNPNNDYHLNILKKGELWFADPNSFNDPFDCKVEYKSKDEFSFSEKEQALKDFIQRHPEAPQQKFDNNMFDIIYDKVYEDEKNILRVLSLCEDEKNILMWSHYANNHEGFCVGFKTYTHQNAAEDNLFIKIKKDQISEDSIQIAAGIDSTLIPLIPVVYSDDKPTPRVPLSANTEGIEKYFIQKSAQWSYEKELRAVLWNGFIKKENKPIAIDKNEIAEIIFGLKSKSVFKEEVINIVSSYSIKPKIYECGYVKGKYAVEKVEVQY